MLQNGELFQADNISKRVGLEFPGVFVPASMPLTSLANARFSEILFVAPLFDGPDVTHNHGRI